ncbi:MAG TPA: Hpt domain-containing protein [Thauera sp.]|nr:Hpt domain-containing protein [Thauera sp.]
MTKPRCRHFDPDALLHDMFEHREAVRGVLQTYLAWQQDLLAQLHAAAQVNDLPRLAHIAHTARGSLSQFRAHASVAHARALEAGCRALDTPEATAATRSIAELVERLSTELEALGAEIAAYLEADEG